LEYRALPTAKLAKNGLLPHAPPALGEGSAGTNQKFEPDMLHVVEIRFAGENFKEVISRVRGWLNCENAQPRTFRYWLSEPDTVLRVSFEFEEQAQAFAQAFGGVVLV
jgi:hypothetical protein